MARKFLVTAGLAVVFSGLAFAQRGNGPRSFGSPSGFGNILYPGTGNAPPIRTGGPSFAQQLGATVAGRPYPGVRPNPSGVPNRPGPVYVPYAYPVYVSAPYPEYPPQQPIYVMQAPAQAQPPVIINNNYLPETANPVMKQYQDGDVPASSGLRSYEAPGPVVTQMPGNHPSTIIEDKATIYLLVYKDQSVHPSIAYWVKEDTLHYITLQGNHNRVSLDLVDVPYSEKLNGERKVEFSLANPK